MQRRMWASAQHSSSELGSAFALHHTCNVNKEKVRPAITYGLVACFVTEKA